MPPQTSLRRILATQKALGAIYASSGIWQGERARTKRKTKGICSDGCYGETLEPPEFGIFRRSSFVARRPTTSALCCRLLLSLTWATSSTRTLVHPIAGRLCKAPSLITAGVFGRSSLVQRVGAKHMILVQVRCKGMKTSRIATCCMCFKT